MNSQGSHEQNPHRSQGSARPAGAPGGPVAPWDDPRGGYPPRLATRAEIRAGLGEQTYRDMVRGAWMTDALGLLKILAKVGVPLTAAYLYLVYQAPILEWLGTH